MARSFQPRENIDFCLLPKILVKNTGNNVSKNLSGKYSQKPIVHAKQSATNAFKTALKKATEKQQKKMVICLEKKVAEKNTKAFRTLPKNNLETVTNGEEKVGFG